LVGFESSIIAASLAGHRLERDAVCREGDACAECRSPSYEMRWLRDRQDQAA
jgi:hypothetical protein